MQFLCSFTLCLSGQYMTVGITRKWLSPVRTTVWREKGKWGGSTCCRHAVVKGCISSRQRKWPVVTQALIHSLAANQTPSSNSLDSENTESHTHFPGNKEQWQSPSSTCNAAALPPEKQSHLPRRRQNLTPYKATPCFLPKMSTLVMSQQTSWWSNLSGIKQKEIEEIT